MPDWTAELRARLSTVRLSPTREADILEELAQHLDDRWRALIGQGIPPDEAERLTRAALSEDPDLLGRRLAGLRQAQWIDPAPPAASRPFSIQGLGADLRHAIRTLRATPSFTIAALLVLTLGIGATTAIFSIVDAVVLRSLPFDAPDRLVAVGERRGGLRAITGNGQPAGSALQVFGGQDPEALASVQPQNYLDWIAHQRSFTAMAAISNAEFALLAPGRDPEAVRAQRVTASFFDVLRVHPSVGHAFIADQEAAGRDRVIVLSHDCWQRRFNGDPAIVGRTLSLDGVPHEVVGVMPAGFGYPVGSLTPAEMWLPYVMADNERIRQRGHSFYLQTIARLRDGVTLEQARADMRQLALTTEHAWPDWNRGSDFGVRPLQDHLVGASVRAWMLMLLAAVAIVLLIACANVGHLLLARETTRQREAAVRAALGASRWRLVRASLIESLLLSVSGTILSIILAWWAVILLRETMPADMPRVTAIALNWRVLGAASTLALVTGLLCGVLPALRSSRPDLVGALNQGTRAGGAGRRRQLLRHVLVVAELALALVLVVGAALFIGSFIRVMRLDPGFNADHVLTAQVFKRPLPGQPRPNLAPAFAEIVERLQHLPGVVSASASYPGIPLRPNSWIDGFSVPGVPPETDRGVSIKAVTPDYFNTLGIPLRSGRLFTGADRADTGAVVIVNETAARTYFGHDSPLARAAGVGGTTRTIIGIVGDARQGNLETPVDPEVYIPLTQTDAPGGFLAIRTSGDPYQQLASVRSAVLASLPSTPVRYVTTLDELLAGQTAQRRVTMLMLALFGVLGLAIAAVGVYGAMAYLVAQRTREIGVRMALGASRGRVVSMVLGRATWLVVTGVTIGSAGSWLLAGTVKSFLFNVEATDVRGFTIAALALCVAGLAACIVPAWRAASVDPTEALRTE